MAARVSISRRDVGRGMLAGLVLAACRGGRDTPRSDRPRAPRPRSLVVISMRGGVDAVLTTSPKRQREVDASIDVPYGPSDIFEHGGNQFGPHLKPLASQLGSFAIINNVHVGTVKHDTGEAQLVRLRSKVGPTVPIITDVIGWYREGPPLGSVSVGGRTVDASSTGSLDCMDKRILSGDQDKNLCDALTALSPEELERSARALDQLAERSASGGEMRRHSTDTAAFMRRLATVPPFREETWMEEVDPSERLFFNVPRVRWMARDFQRTLWLLENELTACVNLGCRELEWDSHVDNLDWQLKMNSHYYPLLARFMSELQTRRNRHGTLASQTMIVMGSELGRNPGLNAHKGKDHFPEMPLFFAGPNVNTNGQRGAVYGATGRRMDTLPVDLATGKQDARGTIVGIDDIGATIMKAFGIDPLVHGYTGRHLPFLVDA